MFNRLCLIGCHNKTSANSGCDKPTLHFIPPAITQLIHRFFALAATHKAYLVESFVSDQEANAGCYLFSSMGKRWEECRMTKIIQQHMKQHLGYAINMQQLRHILPGIADHYNVGMNSVSPGRLIQHIQMGHDENTGDRIYARNADGHPQLTGRFCHDTMDYCDRWQHIWGFDTDAPDLLLAQRVYKEFELASGRPSPKEEHSCGDKLNRRLDELENNLLKAHTKIESLISIASALVSKLDTTPTPHSPMITPPDSLTNVRSIPPIVTHGPNHIIARPPPNHPPSKRGPKVPSTDEIAWESARYANATTTIANIPSSLTLPAGRTPAPRSQPSTPHQRVGHVAQFTIAGSAFETPNGFNRSHRTLDLNLGPKPFRTPTAVRFESPRGTSVFFCCHPLDLPLGPGKLKDPYSCSTSNQNNYSVVST